MIGILDADSLLYAIGSINTNYLHIDILDRKIEKIRKRTNCNSLILVIEGNRNFRNKHDDNYKKHRVSKKPLYYSVLREYIILNYKPFIASNIESDDVCAIIANYCRSINCNHIIIHIDKDLDQIHGKHYNYNRDEFYSISEEKANYNLCLQLIKGDVTDSKITGIKGYGQKKAEKVLDNKLDISLLSKVFNEYIIAYGEQGIENFYTTYKILKLIDNYPKVTKKIEVLINSLCSI